MLYLCVNNLFSICFMTNRQLVPLLLLGGIFLAAPAVAQKKSDGWGDAGDGWGTPAPKKAAPAKAAKATPAKAAPAMAAPEPAAPAAAAASAGSEWGGASGAAGTAAATGPVYEEQPIGASIAPGFTAAPSRRVTTDYRGRQLAPYVRRSVRSADIAPPTMAAPAPILVPEPEPIAAAPAPMPTAKPATATAATAAGTKNGGAAAATKKAAAPAKKAPAKKADDGWGSGGSGW